MNSFDCIKTPQFKYKLTGVNIKFPIKKNIRRGFFKYYFKLITIFLVLVYLAGALWV